MLLRVGRVVRARAGLAAPQGSWPARSVISDRPSAALLQESGVPMTPLSELITEARDKKECVLRPWGGINARLWARTDAGCGGGGVGATGMASW